MKKVTDDSTAKGTVWPTILQENCQVWLDSDIRSAASLSLPPSLSLYAHKPEDLRHLYHVHLMSSSLQLSNTLPTTLWGRQLPMYACVTLPHSFNVFLIVYILFLLQISATVLF